MIPGSGPLGASSDERAFLSHQQVLILGWCLTWSTCLEKTCCLCMAASRGGGAGAGDAPLPATALLRQTGGNLHAPQPAGGVLKRQPISQVCSICAASVTQTNLSPCFS